MLIGVVPIIMMVTREKTRKCIATSIFPHIILFSLDYLIVELIQYVNFIGSMIRLTLSVGCFRFLDFLFVKFVSK